jgi:KaiC/GvpD/RAD55 family RecA-like ATPase
MQWVMQQISSTPFSTESLPSVARFVYHVFDGCDDGVEVLWWWRKNHGFEDDGSFRRELEILWLSLAVTPDTSNSLALSDRGIGAADVVTEEGSAEIREMEDGDIAGVNIEPTTAAAPSILDRYALNHQLSEIDALAVESKLILGAFALLGQSTVIYGAPNSGKTLIVLALIIAALRAGLIDKGSLYYVNTDDTAAGLAEKIRIANEFGFLMLAEGFSGFVADALEDMLLNLAEENAAVGKIVVLDTVTKFVNVLDAGRSRRFMKAVRRFVARGGTVICLAHNNKNPDAKGKPVYRGTSDIINDADCAYVLSIGNDDGRERVVLFENRKRRGDVKLVTGYRYITADNISYHERLASVEEVDPNSLDEMRAEEVRQDDTKLIDAIATCIRSGVTTKMLLAEAAAKRALVSKRTAIKVIERYTGDDPATCWWRFRVHERGAKVFELLSLEDTPAAHRD